LDTVSYVYLSDIRNPYRRQNSMVVHKS